MQAVKAFLSALFRLPIYIRVWLIILGIFNLVCPLFFYTEPLAQLLYLTTMISLALGIYIYKRQGMTKVMGVMHLPWLIFLVQALSEEATLPEGTLFSTWVRIAIFLITISLVFDVADVIRYLFGNRDSTI